jgi:hypothetical protein
MHIFQSLSLSLSLSQPTIITVPIKRSTTYFVDIIMVNDTAKAMSLLAAAAAAAAAAEYAHTERAPKWDILIRFLSLQLLLVLFCITIVIIFIFVIIINSRQLANGTKHLPN